MQATFRYDTTGRWYKGNTHVHSTVSDGGRKPEELWEVYAGLGYDFIFHTDHGVASQYQRTGQADAAPLLVLDGVEIDGLDNAGAEYHVVCLGCLDGIAPGTPLVAMMEAARRQGGIIILAHPNWTGNSFDDALRHGFHGVEVYNNICQALNGKGGAEPFWDAMLGRRPGTLGLAVDDSHSLKDLPAINGGWIVVNAKDRTREAIFTAIRAGNFYASRGPQFHAIETDGKNITFRCSPVKTAHLVGPSWRGLAKLAGEGETITEQTWEIPADWSHMRLLIEDDHGRRAWTNTLFTAEGK